MSQSWTLDLTYNFIFLPLKNGVVGAAAGSHAFEADVLAAHGILGQRLLNYPGQGEVI